MDRTLTYESEEDVNLCGEDEESLSDSEGGSLKTDAKVEFIQVDGKEQKSKVENMSNEVEGLKREVECLKMDRVRLKTEVEALNTQVKGLKTVVVNKKDEMNSLQK